MTRAEECRLRAEEAEERAKGARGLETKGIFLQAAQAWREAAEQVERLKEDRNRN